MSDVLFAILPVFLVMFAGLAADRAALLPPASSMALNVYALRLALPVLLLRIMAGAKPAELFQGRIWFGLLSAQLLAYLTGYAGDRFFLRRGRGPAAVTAMSCSSALTVFVGLPIVMNLLPGNREALVIGAILSVVPVLTIALGQVQLDIESSKTADGRPAGLRAVLVRAVLLNPLILGMLGGALLCLSGLGLWTPLDRAANLIGMTAAPCALLALGLDARRQIRVGLGSRGDHALTRQAGVALVKLVLHPLLTWGVLALCGISGTWLAVCVIMSGAATAVGCYVVADIYKTVPEESALSVVLTNILSLPTLSAFAYAFSALGML